MSKEKKTVELNDEELEQVSGGNTRHTLLTCPKNLTQCGPACAGCPHLQVDGYVTVCEVNASGYVDVGMS